MADDARRQTDHSVPRKVMPGGASRKTSRSLTRMSAPGVVTRRLPARTWRRVDLPAGRVKWVPKRNRGQTSVGADEKCPGAAWKSQGDVEEGRWGEGTVGIGEPDDGDSEHDGRALIGWRLCDLPQSPISVRLSTRRSFVLFFSMQVIPRLLARQDPCIGPNDCPEPEPCNCAPGQDCIIINRLVCSVLPGLSLIFFIFLGTATHAARPPACQTQDPHSRAAGSARAHWPVESSAQSSFSRSRSPSFCGIGASPAIAEQRPMHASRKRTSPLAPPTSSIVPTPRKSLPSALPSNQQPQASLIQSRMVLLCLLRLDLISQILSTILIPSKPPKQKVQMSFLSP